MTSGTSSSYIVVIENDNINTIDYVMHNLMVKCDFTREGAYAMARIIDSEGSGIVYQSDDIKPAIELAGVLLKRGLKARMQESSVRINPRYALAISEISKLISKDQEFISRTLKYGDWYQNMVNHLNAIYSGTE